MSIALFRPELWSARLRRHLDNMLVYASPAATNRDYEGEIGGVGSTLNIQRIGDPNIKEYTKYTDIDAPEQPAGDRKTLVIDEDWYFNVSIDSVDEAQTIPRLLDGFAMRAARGMRVQVDSSVAGVMVVGAGVEVGTDAVPVVIDPDGAGDFTPYKFGVELRRELDNEDAPDEGRWMVIPPDLEAAFLNDPRFIDAGDAETRTGMIGRVAGFNVLKTTAVPTSVGSGGAPVPNYKVVFGAGNYATTHANQAPTNMLEAYQPEGRVGEDAVKGRQVWGSKVIEPETLGVAHVESA